MKTPFEILQEKRINKMANREIDREIFDKAMRKIGYGTMTIQLELDTANIFYAVIFTHWFAKKFWGDEEKIVESCAHCKDEVARWHAWQYHLQQMVLQEEPLKYLEKFL